MKKKYISENAVIVGSKEGNLFPVGFKYRIAGSIYKIVDAFRQDNTEMRELKKDDGTVEIVMVSTLKKDVKDISFTILEDPNKDKEN